MARVRTRRPSLLSPFAYARRAGIYRGLLGGDRRWLIIGGTVIIAGRIRRMLGRQPEIVTIEELKPGHPLRLEAIAPPSRRERRRLAKR
jgi:hypothetical protein